MRAGSIGMSNSGDSGSCSSAAKPAGRKMKKRSMFDGLNNDTVPRDQQQHHRSQSSSTPLAAAHRTKENSSSRHQGEDNNNEIDESYGFGCVSCGRWRHDPQDPFGVKSVLRTMIQDKFSSRVDFSEEAERRYHPVAVNFVEHRL